MADFENIRFVLAIARQGSFSGAARVLRVDFSTVKRRLRALEATMGITLFERHAGGQRPTKAGRDYIDALERADMILTHAERSVVAKDARLEGVLRIATTYTFFNNYLIDQLSEFTERYPSIQLAFQFSNSFHDLSNREADLVIRFSNDPGDSLVGTRICPIGFTYFGIPETQKRWLGWSEGPKPDWIERSPFPDAPVWHHAQGEAAQIELAARGFGMAWLPCYLGDKHSKLKRMSDNKPWPLRDLWVLCHSDFRSTPRIRAFRDFITTRLKSDTNLFSGKE